MTRHIQCTVLFAVFCVSLFSGQATVAQTLPPEHANAIGRLNLIQFNRRGHCTTVLVSPHAVLTAQRCVDLWPAKETHILLGYDRGKWTEHHRVKDVHRIPEQGLAILCLRKKSVQRPFPIASLGTTLSHSKATIWGYTLKRLHRLQGKECRYELSGTKAVLDCRTQDGLAGAPMLIEVDGTLLLAGVVTGRNKTRSSTELAADLPQPCGR